MSKKRIGRNSFSYQNKKAQVTIFIIVGIVIFFVFVLMISMATSFKKSQLESGKEKVVTQIFRKEALRIYVEDCLNDELEDGLILLGKQGRFWSDQPGGIKSFINQQTGIQFGSSDEGGRIFYVITKKYPPFPPENENAYPCKDDDFSPEFCQYHFPNISVEFGQLQLKESTLQEDLRRYLYNRTVWCVENYTKTNISSSAKVESTEMQIQLQVLDEGIDVKVDYPLKLKLGGQEFFQLTTFDFFYPSQLLPFLRSAITIPLENDLSFSDFNYTQETLEKESFEYFSEKKISDSCLESEFGGKNVFLCSRTNLFETYKNLGINLTLEKTSNGDDIFIFSTNQIGEIVRNQPYSFRIARQNRPPALDYINRYACPEKKYDYLVVKDDLELGSIDINLSAKDPDEDGVNFGIELGTLPGLTLTDENKLTADISKIYEGKYEFIAKVFESENPKSLDSQNVRILVDKVPVPTLNLKTPYGTFQSGDYYYVSREDPTLLEFNYPESLGNFGVEQEVSLKYSGGEEVIFPLDEIFGTQGCFGMPEAKPIGCQEDFWTDYDIEDILNLNPGFPENGDLTLSLDKEYCGLIKKPTNITFKVAVRECIPYRNPEHPWPSPYEKYTYGLNPDGTTNFKDYKKQNTLEPFNANHVCCAGGDINDSDTYNTWSIVPEIDKKDCFVSPKYDCSGKIPGLTTGNKKGYLFEEEYVSCDGLRGNTCEGPKKYRLLDSGKEMVCGNVTWWGSLASGCKSGIPKQCKGRDAYSYIDNNADGVKEGICLGILGCEKFCGEKTNDLVSLNPDKYPNYKSYSNFNDLAEKEYKDEPLAFLDLEEEFGLICGCKIGNVCDANFDGVFNGICLGNVCHSTTLSYEQGAEEPVTGKG